LVSEEIINKLIISDNINNIKNTCFNCIFAQGKLIINYPNNINGNKEYISVIGELNEQNIFLPEYILIFNSDLDRKSYLGKMKKNLDEYLQNFIFENNSNIITERNKNIGIIVKYNSDKHIAINQDYIIMSLVTPVNSSSP
jgi:hypothetical protein